jgi:hypothetical protein
MTANRVSVYPHPPAGIKDEATRDYLMKLYRALVETGRDGLSDLSTHIQVLGSGDGLPIASGTAAPTVGQWKKGAIVFNSSPGAESPVLWRCTVAGTPGTWEAVSAGGDAWSKAFLMGGM